jgi:hypothetical protein
LICPLEPPLLSVCPQLSAAAFDDLAPFSLRSSSSLVRRSVAVAHPPAEGDLSGATRPASAPQQLHVHTTELVPVAGGAALLAASVSAVFAQLCRAALGREPHPDVARLLRPGAGEWSGSAAESAESDAAMRDANMPDPADCDPGAGDASAALSASPASIRLCRAFPHLREDQLVPLLLSLRADQGRLRELQLAVPAAADQCAAALTALLLRSSPSQAALLSGGAAPIAAPLSGLRLLSLSGCGASEPALRRLLPLLAALPALTQIDLSATAVGDSCIGSLRRMIGKSAGLKALRIDECAALTAVGMEEKLAEALTCSFFVDLTVCAWSFRCRTPPARPRWLHLRRLLSRLLRPLRPPDLFPRTTTPLKIWSLFCAKFTGRTGPQQSGMLFCCRSEFSQLRTASPLSAR